MYILVIPFLPVCTQIIATIYAGRQVCNRWLLAYTLIRNPSLASRRRTNKKAKLSDDATATIFMSEEDGSMNNNERQEGQANSNHSLTNLENKSGTPACDIVQQPDNIMAESVCMVETNEPQAVFPCEPVKECVTVDEACRTEVRQ